MGKEVSRVHRIQNFFEDYLFWLDLPEISVIDIVEIAILAVFIYQLMRWIKDTRAWMLLKGILSIGLFTLVASIFRMDTILWLISKIISVGIIAVVIVFQPELRKALEQLGRKNILTSALMFDTQKETNNRFSEKTLNEIVRAAFEMGKVRTGALIVMERQVLLNDFVSTGIQLDALASAQLLINIFEHNTPLHDGAVIIRGDRVLAATCYLPLSENMNLSKELGTRHRAAVGLSEVSDALTIIVSEETGKVSVAAGGEIIRNVDAEFLRNKLYEMQKKNAELKKVRRKKVRRSGEDGND